MARETYQVYRDLGKDKLVKGFVINKPLNHKGGQLYELPIFDESILNKRDSDITLICGVGTPLRKPWIDKLESENYKFGQVIHPSVITGSHVNLSQGVIICANSTLTCEIEINKHSIINVNTTIHHDCKIGRFVTISSGVNIGGKVIIDDECFIGVGVSIIHGVTIGKGSFIGAGAVVVDDIPPYTLALGVPAKPIRSLLVDDWKSLI